MSKQAYYHQDSKAPVLLDVIKSHKNGTVDLGVEGVVKISECEVSDDPTSGSCTLVKDEDPKVAKGKVKAAAESSEADTTEEAAK